MKRNIVRWATAVSALLLPSPLARFMLNALGHRIARGGRIGISLVLVDQINMGPGTRIGHFNLIHIRRLVMRQGSYLGRMNVLNGPFSLALGPQAALGNSNKVVRGPLGTVTVGPAYLKLGRLSKITSNHRIDCTRSVTFGDYCTMAGIGSMVWTHGYVHAMEGPSRYRIDGPIMIENNVNIGAGCILSLGIRIASGVMLGAGVTVARDLLEPGLYVSSPLRRLPMPENPDQRANFQKVSSMDLCETVYLKRPR